MLAINGLIGGNMNKIDLAVTNVNTIRLKIVFTIYDLRFATNKTTCFSANNTLCSCASGRQPNLRVALKPKLISNRCNSC